jgi:hypothetical protein
MYYQSNNVKHLAEWELEDVKELKRKPVPAQHFPPQFPYESEPELSVGQCASPDYMTTKAHYEFQKELYNFECLYRFIQRTCTAF